MANDVVTTGEIMDFLRENMVTKEDAKGFATKDDLKAFITKEDARAFATKDDLKAFATKDDLFMVKMEIEELKISTKQDMRDLRNDVITHIDAFAKNAERQDHEITSLNSHCERIDTRLDTIECRIGIPH